MPNIKADLDCQPGTPGRDQIAPDREQTAARPECDDIVRDREGYIRQVLRAYRATPGTTGRATRQDRLLATQLFQQGIPFLAVENAMLLASARRLFRPVDSPPLPVIRSLAYFSPVIQEVLGLNVSQDYFRYLSHKLDRLVKTSAANLSFKPHS